MPAETTRYDYDAILDAIEERAPIRKRAALTALASKDGFGPTLSRREAEDVVQALDYDDDITVKHDVDGEAFITTAGDAESAAAARSDVQQAHERIDALEHALDDVQARLSALEDTSEDGGEAVGHFGNEQDQQVREHLSTGATFTTEALTKFYLNYTTHISSVETAREYAEKNKRYAMDMEYDEEADEFTYTG